MIIDRLENAGTYCSISSDIAEGLAFLRDCTHEPGSRYTLTPTLSASVSQYETLKRGKRKWEAHDHLIDVHYMIEGAEVVTWASRKDLEYSGKEPDSDVLRFKGEGTEFILKAGMFCIMFSDDVHITKIADREPQNVLKCVLKLSI